MSDYQTMHEAIETPTTLNGRAVWLARVAWMAIFLLVLGMVVANAPHLVSDTLQEWQVNKAVAAALTFFPTPTGLHYAVVLNVADALVFGVTALFLVWRK